MLVVELIALALAVPGAVAACIDVIAHPRLIARPAPRQASERTAEMTFTVHLSVRLARTNAPGPSSRLV